MSDGLRRRVGPRADLPALRAGLTTAQEVFNVGQPEDNGPNPRPATRPAPTPPTGT
jgi:hypothetical protein